jgi:hypothetical protein
MAHLIRGFFTKVAICMLVFAIVSGCVTEAPAAGDEVLVRKRFYTTFKRLLGVFSRGYLRYRA